MHKPYTNMYINIHVPSQNTVAEQIHTHTATRCNTLQHTVGEVHSNHIISEQIELTTPLAATHCNTLQHTATHCVRHIIPQQYALGTHRGASHCNTLQHTATHGLATHRTWNTSHCNTLQHPATPCNILSQQIDPVTHHGVDNE